MISVFQIYYSAETQKHLDPAFYPYLNREKDEYFESRVIRQVYQMPTGLLNGMSYIGVSSWKQFQKSHITGQEILSRINADIDNGTAKDVYLYTPIVYGLEMTSNYPAQPREIYGHIKGPDIWQMHKQRGEQYYQDNKLLNDSGVLPVNLFDGKWQYCMCNYWIARKDVFNDYCKNWLVPAMDFFKTVEHKMPKHYGHAGEGRLCTSICFTLEGLFGSFLAHSNYSFEYLVKKRYCTEKKYSWVNITGYENTMPFIQQPTHPNPPQGREFARNTQLRALPLRGSWRGSNI
jgi:hypothetical protein